MITQPTFTAQELSAYAKALGWLQVQEAVKDGLFVFNHPQYQPQQLVFAIDERFADYNETLLRAATRLAQLYDWSPLQAVRKIEESSSEVLLACVPDVNRHLSTVAFTYALQVLEAQKELLLAGAAANGRRQTHYATTLAGDGKKMLDAARFRHTEESSFIFKASCRLYEFEGEDTIPLFSVSEDPIAAPFVRRAMLNIGEGVQDVVRSIETRKTDKLVEEVKGNGTSSVSSNLCQAIVELRDREHPHAIDLSIAWSPLLPPPPQAPREPIRIAPDFFPIIEDIAKELRPVRKPVSDSYAATVEQLQGTFNKMGQREGKTLLLLLSSRDGTIDGPTQVRVVLDAPKYNEALEIHRTTKVMARVTGTIKLGQRQPFEFELEKFEIMNVNQL